MRILHIAECHFSTREFTCYELGAIIERLNNAEQKEHFNAGLIITTRDN